MGKIKFFWALDKKLERISINDAESGANGYYCEGCKNEMEACKGQEVRPYFRHHTKLGSIDIKECNWSNENARHAIGKDILQMEKQIKVPSLYIEVPPEYRYKRNEVEFTKIRSSHTIQAYEVLKEKYVYENEFGEVKYTSGENKEIEKKYLHVKPDVIFLDKGGKIILLVELHATHKVDHQKQAKLFRLGIDAIEVKIPKAHDNTEIGNNFKITKNTKWLYNHEQATTKFNPQTHLAGKGSKRTIIDGGDFLPEEAYECRAFRINEALRSIKGLLGGAEFNERRNAIGGELLRIEQVKERFRERLSDRNSRAATKARESLAKLEELEKQQIDKLTEQEIELTGEEDKEQPRYQELEGRYNKAEEKLRGEEREAEQLGRGVPERVFDFNGSLEREERELHKGFSAEENSIREQFYNKIAELRTTIQQLFESINLIRARRAGLAEKERKIELASEGAQRDLETERGNIDAERGAYKETFERLGRIRIIRKEFSDLQDQALQKRSNKRN
jgi:hypothetical protein